MDTKISVDVGVLQNEVEHHAGKLDALEDRSTKIEDVLNDIRTTLHSIDKRLLMVDAHEKRLDEVEKKAASAYGLAMKVSLMVGALATGGTTMVHQLWATFFGAGH